MIFSADCSAWRCHGCFIASSKVFLQLWPNDICHGLATVDIVIDFLTAITCHTEGALMADCTRVQGLVASAFLNLHPCIRGF